MVAEMRDAAEEMRRLFVEGLQDAAENFTGGEAQKNTTQEGGVKRQARQSAYDYSKSFAQQVDDYDNHLISKSDSLIVGPTPDVLQKVGFNTLPVTINTTHVDYALYGTKDADHYLGKAALKQLPQSIKDPVAVFVSQTQSKTSVVALLNFKTNGKQTVAPVLIDGFGKSNGIIIDSNAITSIFGKTNAVSKLLFDAVNDESKGKFSLLYWNKKEATSLLHRAGLQLPGTLIPHDGFIHSIRENASPVKPKFENIAESQQFKRWFGDWKKRPQDASKVVNSDGTPMVVYHQTGNEFTVFDPKHSGAGSSDQQTPFGIFLKTSSKDIGVKGKKQMALYANIRNPLRAVNRSDLTRKLKQLSADYAALCEDYDNMNLEFQKKQEDAGKKLDEYMLQWRKENPAASRRDIYEDKTFNRLSDAEDDIITLWEQEDQKLSTKAKTAITKALRDAGYDGVFLSDDTGSWGRKTDAIIALDPEQVKSATDNVGTFDKSNPDIRYSLRDQDVRKMNDVLEKQNEKLREDVASLKELLRMQKSVTGGKLLNQNSLDTAAGYLMRSSGAKGNKAELSGLLKDVYSYIAGDEAVTWDGIMEKSQPAADWLSEHMETKRQPDPYGAEVLKELRGSRIYLDESQKAEAQYQFGSVNAFRKQLFGTVTITDKDAVSLDSKWAELSQMYPDVFDPNTSAADMPGALLDAIDSLKNMGIGEMWYDKEAARQDLLQQIYDGYWRVSTLHTVADVKQKQIDRLKGEHIARLNKIKAQNREDIQKLKSEHRADMKKLREDMRKSSLEKQEKIRKQYQDSRAKSVEGRHRTEMRHKVQRVVKDLNDLLLNGTKEKHVPIELQKAAAEALDAVNMDTVGAEERIARLEDALTKTKDPKKMQEISRKIENIQKMGSSMQEKLQRLKAGYDAIMQSEDPLIANAYSPEIAGQLMTLTVTAGDTPLRDMSLKQLEAVYNAYTMVLTTIRNANKTFKAARNATVQELSQKVMTEVSGAGGKRQYSLPAMEAIRKFGWNNLKPVYAFELMGSKTFSDIFKNVRKGEDIWAVDVNEARDFYLEQVKKYGYNQWDMGKQYEFTSATGETFRLGLPQIMSLYAYSKREQAADHLRKGGIVIDETTEVSVKTKLGITMKFNPTEATAYNISDETLIEIVGKLTKEQRAYVDAMQEYLSTVMGEKGNEVSLQMYGIKLFGEKNYFPLRSAQQYLARAKEQQQGDRKIKNAGFSKQTVAHAGNPVVLSGFMDVWADHVNEMSMYHAFVLPMEDFYRVWNYNTGNKDTEQSRSVNAAVQNAFGIAATGYIDQLLKDLNGGARMDPTTGIISRGMNLFKKGAVFASASVVIQQPSAIGRALSMIDMKYFAGSRITKENHKDSWNQLKKYAPVAAIKEMGYFDTNMGKSTKDYILGQEYDGFGEKTKALFTDSGYRDEALSRGAALADEITWCNIWEAVKRETKAKHPNLSVRSEAFLQMAGERFTDVIVKTQVYDSVLSRSGNMRSKDTGMKMATAFMAEPTTSINMIVDALVQGKRNGAEGRRYCRRAIGAVVAAQVINSILVSFVYAARDDDEDETYLEKYLESLVGGITDSINPATYIPFLKDIMSIVQGYDVERSDMAVVSDLWKAWKQLGSQNLTPWRKVEGFAGSLCQIFGLPVKNIMRDVRGCYQMFESITGPEKNTLAGAKYAIKEGVGEKTSIWEQMYDAYAARDQEHLDRVEDRYIRNSDAPNERRAEKELQSGFQNYMKKQFLDEKVTEQEVRDILHGYLEMDLKDVDAALNQWKGELETGKTESDMEDDYLRKDISGEAYIEYLRTYSGKSQEQAEKAELKLRCERDEGIAYSEIKELYMNGDLSGDRASILMETYDEETSEADAKERILEWDFESAYGIAYSDRKRAFLDGEISQKDLLTGLQKYGGYDKEDAEEYVEKLVFEDKYGFAYSEKKSAYLNGEVSRSVLKNILIKEMEYSEENAELTMQAYDWQKVHPESKYDTTSIKSYLKPLSGLDYSAKECGIPVDTYVKGKKHIGNIKSDKDKNGKGIPYSRINKAFPYIDNLPLTSEQKTAFAVACGWSLKTVKKNKLW